MRRPIIIVIAISFILTQLQIFMPIFLPGVTLPLLVINMLLIFDVNILQKRPSIEELTYSFKKHDSGFATILQKPDVKLYFILSLFCIVVAFTILLSYLLGDLHRQDIYDIAIIIPAHLYFLIFGTIE
jgi:hypothetical protein